jgi:ribonuclease HI
LEKVLIEIYSDGSCHTQLEIGAWAAIVFINDEKIILKDSEVNTTHNRMEMLGVIKAIEYGIKKVIGLRLFAVFSDSQYVIRIRERKERLQQNNFITNKGTPIQNVDLVKRLIELIETEEIKFIKVKAHSRKEGDPVNREVDILVRELLREKVNEHGYKK